MVGWSVGDDNGGGGDWDAVGVGIVGSDCF